MIGVNDLFFFRVFIIIIIVVIGVAGFDWLNIGDCWRLEMDRLHAVWRLAVDDGEGG